MEELIEILEVEEEDIYLERPRRRGPTKIRNRVDHFNVWDNADFFMRFRMSKRTASMVLDMIREEISTKTQKNRALSPEQKFLTALRFYASGSFLIGVGDHSGIHYSTASKVVRDVSTAIARLVPHLICMPTGDEQNQVKLGFYGKARFPNCIGAIDCTHVKISSPGGVAPELYRNRKGVFSLNVQGVCDANLCFSNIVARWPGSTHDAHIFNSSRLKKQLEQGVFGNGVLVGDSGYGCKNYLLTPLDTVETEAERLYQESQTRTRNPIERCFGVWKRRFPVLALGMRLKIATTQNVIAATALLHNICIREREEIPQVTDEQLAAIEALQNIGGEDNAARQRPRNVRLAAFDLNTLTRNKLINEYSSSML